MEKAFKYIVLIFMAVVAVFIIYALIWVSKTDLRKAIDNLNKIDSTLNYVVKDLSAAKDTLLKAQSNLKAFDSTLQEIRGKVRNLDRSRIQNEVLFERLSKQLSGKIDEIINELNQVSAKIKEPIIHANTRKK